MFLPTTPVGTFWQALPSEAWHAVVMLSRSAWLFLPHMDSPAQFTTEAASADGKKRYVSCGLKQRGQTLS